MALTFDCSKVAFWITTLQRPETCLNTINALLQYYPGAHVYVIDDSPTRDDLDDIIACTPDNVKGFFVEFDAGVSFKRNQALAYTDEPYIVLMDDDNLCTNQTRFDYMLEILENRSFIAVVGHAKRDEGRNRWSNIEGLFKIKNRPDGKVLRTIPLDTRSVQHMIVPGSGELIAWYSVDLAPMCCMVRREVLEKVPFDERYRTCGEHMDWYLRLSVYNGKPEIRRHYFDIQTKGGEAPLYTQWITKWVTDGSQVAFLRDSSFVDTAERPTEYKELRRRGSSFRRQMIARWGFKRISNWNSRLKRRAFYG